MPKIFYPMPKKVKKMNTNCGRTEAATIMNGKYFHVFFIFSQPGG